MNLQGKILTVKDQIDRFKRSEGIVIDIDENVCEDKYKFSKCSYCTFENSGPVATSKGGVRYARKY